MSEKKYLMFGMGNALVDLEFEVSDNWLSQHKLSKGHMTLVDSKTLENLLLELNKTFGSVLKQQGGGSAANTVMAVTQMGGKCFYACKVAQDSMGEFYLNELTEAGIDHTYQFQSKPLGETGRCLVLITPDAERTMVTSLAITTTFSTQEIVAEALRKAQMLYVEGYLMASPAGVQAAHMAIEMAQALGVKVATTFSDVSMVKSFRQQFLSLLGAQKKMFCLFCNSEEALAFCQTNDLLVAREELKKYAQTFVITRGENGAVIFDGDTFIDIASYPVKAVDTNGAGDMFAGAFLFAVGTGHTHASAGKLASIASSKVVGQFGPRLKWHQCQEIVQSVFGQK
jgi:sugar/nucleoside kinase (ribokinase family)